jgi:hypothetical protein
MAEGGPACNVVYLADYRRAPPAYVLLRSAVLLAFLLLASGGVGLLAEALAAFALNAPGPRLVLAAAF